MIGHSDISVTMNAYTHPKLEDAKDELEKLKIREQVKKEMALRDMEYAISFFTYQDILFYAMIYQDRVLGRKPWNP